MLLVFHISIAIVSMAYTVYVFAKPSKNKLLVTYGLVGVTLLTGFALALSNPGHVVQTCEVGLAYLAFVLLGIFSARHKLAGSISK